jgi:hypothetical protein
MNAPYVLILVLKSKELGIGQSKARRCLVTQTGYGVVRKNEPAHFIAEGGLDCNAKERTGSEKRIPRKAASAHCFALAGTRDILAPLLKVQAECTKDSQEMPCNSL